MRRHVLLAAVNLLAAGIVAPATGQTRSAPSPDEIIKSLTPSRPIGSDPRPPRRACRAGTGPAAGCNPRST